ncbi:MULTISPECIES: benzoate/H(+) symporter BenE family transporter [unclassified Caballeronia]|uniref:benzoate/H(+) symporter BenE family transporter n=1 Tax=unclassified Caballeronia TaxID=2646786 RepID=UPI001F34972A|nr:MULTISPECIES: benzoate/H(+) symporter BenE family transporter [unclassified Caballeronia]MCE4545670.1 benzoate/H(+) symporter BenE family transporter [Caballeronia sp. PC1]MCE4572206.1 benzoate/H(+) symporter BenE family transporter [Caballeronia sp. CLC5]
MGDWSVSAVSAGLLAVIISYAGPLAIFFQAAHAAHVGNEVVASWVWSISMGAALSGIVLSAWLKQPVITAWSAPGTALLVTLFPGMPVSEAIGAYIVAGACIFALGVSGFFDQIVKRIPKGIACAMMAGILFQFGVNVFKSVAVTPALALGMLASFIVFRRFAPRYCLILVLAFGGVLAVALGLTHFESVSLHITRPVFTMPTWSWQSTVSLAVPLVIVSLTGQFLPGFAILRASGYETPTRPVLVTTSAASMLVAFSGGITIVIAAITAALCTGPDAHRDPRRRYVAGIANGLFYLIGGCFAGTVVMLFAALPNAFVAVLAGLALLGAIAANIVGLVQDEAHREASFITFIATASNMSFLGLGSAFWGIVLGTLAHLVLGRARPTR